MAGAPQPLRATVPFQLQQRRGDGGRAASVPCAAAAEWSRRARQPRVRRTSSLDTVLGSYLLGQWPRDPEGAAASRVSHKATQTPVSWHDAAAGRAGAHQRSASWGSADHHREIVRLKQQLQRTKLNGRSGKEKERSSPLLGDHAVRASLRDSPSGFLCPSPVVRLSPCLHRSLEGLNQELEEAFVKEQGDEELLRILDVPDGHRAPAPAQGGSGAASLALDPGSGSSLSLSPSPSAPLRPVAAEPSPAADEGPPAPKDKGKRCRRGQRGWCCKPRGAAAAPSALAGPRRRGLRCRRSAALDPWSRGGGRELGATRPRAALHRSWPLLLLPGPTTATCSNGNPPRDARGFGPSKKLSPPALSSRSTRPARTRTKCTSTPRALPSAPSAWSSRSSPAWGSSAGGSSPPARAPARPARPQRPARSSAHGRMQRPTAPARHLRLLP